METKETKITLGLIVGWILGVLVGIAGVGLLFTELVPGILFLLLALVLLPPVNRMLKEKFNLSLSGGVKVVLVIVLFGIAGATMDTESTSTSNPVVENTPQEVVAESEADTESSENVDEPETVVQESADVVVETNPEPVVETLVVTQNQPTLGEKQAIRAAQNYIDFRAFSKSGLIEQLEFEGYSRTEAEYGVENITVDWNEQAALSAKAYLEYSNFSRSGLIEQLKFEGFTTAQAQYGATAVGY